MHRQNRNERPLFMPQSEPTCLLIAQSVPADNEKLAQLRPLLAQKFGLDAFLLKQRLVGRGPNLIAEGERNRLTQIATLMAEQGIRCRIIASQPPRFVPLRLRGVRRGNQTLSLLTDERVVDLGPEHRVLAILADLSGRAASKSLKHQVAQRVYNGIRAPRPLSDEELAKAALGGKPIVDLYRLDEEGKVDAGVRIFPGRFDPGGLGDLATLSTVGNLKAILTQVRKHAGSFRLQLDFGLANLPGCRLKTSEDGLHWQRDNLAALTRFGWLMAELDSTPAVSDPSSATVHPLVETLQKEIEDAEAETTAGEAESSSPVVTLPPPPSTSGAKQTTSARLTLGMAAAAGFGLLTATGTDQVATALRFSLRTGLLPALLSGLCCWGGFHFLRLKRHIENTPTSKTRSLSMGLVELQGRAIRKYALVSPVSQLPCVFYRLRKYRRDSKNNWRLKSSSDSDHVPFYLEDDTGRVTIDPRGASVSARQRQEFYGDRTTSLFGNIGAGSNEKWIEDIVAENTHLYILGQAREKRRPRTTLRDRVTRALQELKRDPDAMQKYDRDGDGRICASEWEQARTRIEQQVLQDSLAESPGRQAQSDRVLVGRPRQRSIPYVIAETASERHLLRNYTLLILPLFVGALGGLVWTVLTLRDYLLLQ